MQTIFRINTVFVLVSLLGMLWACFAFSQSLPQDFLADSWFHKESGSILEIDLKGNFEIIGGNETVIETGTISFWVKVIQAVYIYWPQHFPKRIPKPSASTEPTRC